MAGRYTVEDLVLLSQSPLCVKPPGLPPPEEWMGPPPETTRNPTKPVNDRSKGSDSILLDNRRSGTDRNAPRNNSHPDDIILAPPRTSFTSSSIGAKPSDGEKGSKDAELRDRSDRFNFRNKSTETDALHDRFRDARNSNFRREQDGDTRSMVKPRKSFGNEGAERFQGRIGGVDRFPNRDDRRTRDRDDRDNGERRTRNFDHHSQDKEGDDADGARRNGLGRGRSDPWFKEGSEAPPPSQRERIDRTKNWRERDPNDRPSERQSDRPNNNNNNNNNNRGFDRRWDREQRIEREPEWLDEPAEEHPKGHTEEDFKKFMEAMKAGRGGGSKSEDKVANLINRPAPDPAIVAEQKKVVSAPAVESGPDKFFAAYGSAALDNATPVADTKEVTMPKAAKPSRFTSFFSGHEDTRGKTEPPTPAAGPPPPNSMNQPPQPDAEKEAFQVLLQKLQRQTLAGTNQPGSPPQLPINFSEHSIPPGAQHHKGDGMSLESFQQYGVDRRADPRLDPRLRPQSHPIQDILSPRPMAPPAQPPAPRPEQSLQDLMQRHHAPPNQGGVRMEQNSAAANNNAEFLMQLMQTHRNVPEPPRTEQLLSRMAQPAKHAGMPAMSDRDAEYQRERSASQRQIRLPGPPGFLDEQQFHNPEGDNRPQPTQILQRPPPPGLDHHMHPFAMAGGGQMPPQRPMIPPPGILNNPRNMQMPPSMFPPNFPPGAFPPLDGMGGPPAPGPGPRPVQPPPGFYGGPPPGFIPHPGMGNFQGPEGLSFGAVFDGRGMPPPGAAFRRQ